jgi:hypothetical protein
MIVGRIAGVPDPPRFLTYNAVSHRLTGTPSAIGSHKFLVKAMSSPLATAVLEMRVEVPLRVFVERPFGLELARLSHFADVWGQGQTKFGLLAAMALRKRPKRA